MNGLTAARRLVAALAVGLVLVPAASFGTRCLPGSFVVTTQGGGDTTPVLDAIAVTRRSVTIAACGSARLRIRGARDGLRLRARWGACPAFGGAAILKARIDQGCGSMIGVVSSSSGDLTFAATRASNCGTIAGLVCPAGSFCEFPAGTCGVADVGGTCTLVPELCNRRYDPVCGCNGQTYGNDCARQAAGVPKAADGPCH